MNQLAFSFKENVREIRNYNYISQPFKPQLLKWVGNKQRFAHEIITYFPSKFGKYYEPFLGSGGVLGALSPSTAIASDAFLPLMEIWMTLKKKPETLKKWYGERWKHQNAVGKKQGYEDIKERYNQNPNAGDFLFLCRACYGGVVRFRQNDGYMSTPCGVHDPISPRSFSNRVDLWFPRIEKTRFLHSDYKVAMDMAEEGDLIYCDPPYSFSQAILYGAQSFSLEELFVKIQDCKKRRVFIVLSIDGSKKSGDFLCDIKIPDGLFERELAVNCGRSMLKRFQMEGKSLKSEEVTDRLLITY